MATPNFIDYVKLYARSGKGGAGSAHFRRAKYIPKGGPDGGDGGRGGHVILQGNAQLSTLLHLYHQKHVVAPDGHPGAGKCQSGATGKDTVLQVPLGTVVKDATTHHTRLEITQDGAKEVLLHGGKGGLGNVHFKSSTRQTPRYAQPGLPGEEAWLVLELKLMATVGLVGLPNAGKSTLLSVVSAAKPKIAAYPFTTLVPQLGIVTYKDTQSFVMADIPGILEGAAAGKGLGNRFLRHIERNAVLLMMIAADTPHLHRVYNTLVQELRAHNPELMDKPRLLAISKIDLLTEQAQRTLTSKLPPDVDHTFLSAITGQGIDLLKDKLWRLLH